MPLNSTTAKFGLRNPFSFSIKTGAGTLSGSWWDMLAVWRYLAAVKIREKANQAISRIDSTGDVLRLVSAEDYRRMKECREEKAHRLIFPRIMYHESKPSIMVRKKADAYAMKQEGYDFKPPSLVAVGLKEQIATHARQIREYGKRITELTQLLSSSHSENYVLRAKLSRLEREFRERGDHEESTDRQDLETRAAKAGLALCR